MAVAFNAADSAISSRQLISELDYLYKYDPKRHAYVGRSPGTETGSVVNENRPSPGATLSYTGDRTRIKTAFRFI
jgi:hypothetical protein